MKILVTAGNTRVLIDQVRCLTNVFSGRTGAAIALRAWERGHAVTLLTSHPEVLDEPDSERWHLEPYSTFEDLRSSMGDLVSGGGFDVVIHCAAVSDYLAGGVYAPAEGTHFESWSGRWVSGDDGPQMVDRGAGKVKSDEPELWLRLVRAPKLIDLVRGEWGFRGLLVKFKLEVGISEEHLLAVAERSRIHSSSDLMVANRLEDAALWAWLGPLGGRYEQVPRTELAERLLAVLEHHPRKGSDG